MQPHEPGQSRNKQEEKSSLFFLRRKQTARSGREESIARGKGDADREGGAGLLTGKPAARGEGRNAFSGGELYPERSAEEGDETRAPAASASLGERNLAGKRSPERNLAGKRRRHDIRAVGSRRGDDGRRRRGGPGRIRVPRRTSAATSAGSSPTPTLEGFEAGWWADLGTGSGATAVAVARMLGPEGRVFATDVSEVAIEVAGLNAQRYGMQDKVELRHGSWFEPLEDLKGKLMGVISNPPYIPTDDLPGLQPEVGWHELKLALDGGKDELEHLLHLCEGLSSVLKPGGFFV
ncbi:hypothetical protein ABZP36_012354 [Zizania latifolia]